MTREQIELLKKMRLLQKLVLKVPTNINMFKRLKAEIEVDKMLYEETNKLLENVFPTSTLGTYEQYKEWDKGR